MKLLYPYVNLKTINLKYFGNTSSIGKIRITSCVISILLHNGFTKSEVSYWLGVPINLLPIAVKDYHSLKPLVKTGWNRENIWSNVRWFAQHQSPVNVSQQDEDFINELLALPISASKIAREALVKRPIISYLRTGKRTINNLSLATIRRLIFYYKHIRDWASWFDVIRSGFGISCGTGNLLKNDMQEQIRSYHADHLFSKKSAEQLEASHHSWELFIYEHQDKPNSETGIAVDHECNDHIITLNHPDKDSIKTAKAYAHIDYKVRSHATTNASYIRLLLTRKYKSIKNLYNNLNNAHITSKQIAKKLHLNQDFVKLVLS